MIDKKDLDMIVGHYDNCLYRDAESPEDEDLPQCLNSDKCYWRNDGLTVEDFQRDVSYHPCTYELEKRNVSTFQRKLIGLYRILQITADKFRKK